MFYFSLGIENGSQKMFRGGSNFAIVFGNDVIMTSFVTPGLSN